ncbi:TetR/AcrR family transcriptional regulator [Streptomyces halobius]|uniref:TetR/AcrR family transcriptional regulator n=1 Tax=Streptomyces halobius TaxID=2879846 RepID=A0ABY4MH94_9ACTN|nr:TetR/AcrR family transcriptional regulator [Streptomyces halobius]UQA97176.1 TetR/AcrR family transcriptional regulator [Streptomyces halobius]
MITLETSESARRTQAGRRARSRSALLEAAARGLSTYGYANLALGRVASEAGYTRGALYHQFANKEDLALAVVKWVEETWYAEVGRLAEEAADPVEALLAMARGHAVYCRRDVARVMTALSVEFLGQDHPVGRAITEVGERFLADSADRIAAARASGAIPPGPPPREMAQACLGTLEGLVIKLAGHAPYDVELAERAVRGVLGLPPVPLTTGPQSAGAPQSL